jgi:hypothetical protein
MNRWVVKNKKSEEWMAKWLELGWVPAVSYPDNTGVMTFTVTHEKIALQYVANTEVLKVMSNAAAFTDAVRQTLVASIVGKIKKEEELYAEKI